jgi:hypothetical protein
LINLTLPCRGAAAGLMALSCPAQKGTIAELVTYTTNMHVVFTYHMSLVDSSMEPAALHACMYKSSLTSSFICKLGRHTDRMDAKRK